jgi:hypothetical protein
MLSIIGIKKTIKQHTADMDITDSVDYKISTSSVIQGVPELAPQRKQACADNKKDSKLTKINFLLAQITELQSFKFHQSQKLVLRYY